MIIEPRGMEKISITIKYFHIFVNCIVICDFNWINPKPYSTNTIGENISNFVCGSLLEKNYLSIPLDFQSISQDHVQHAKGSQKGGTTFPSKVLNHVPPNMAWVYIYNVLSKYLNNIYQIKKHSKLQNKQYQGHENKLYRKRITSSKFNII